jgi:dihydroorotate dehydrogenase
MLEECRSTGFNVGLPYRMFGRPILGLIDSERAHGIGLSTLSKLERTSMGRGFLKSLYQSPEVPTNVFGLSFSHPLGIAAGFDKKAAALSAWPSLGFSWMEYGGITRFPQDGNPKPRMFRANKENALVNRMGFNNPGALAVRENLIERRSIGLWPNNPVAANIGRSKKVSNDEAADDYSSTLDILWDYADLFVLNVSSPNTPGLRELQEVDHLRDVLTSCIEIRNRKGNYKPILMKFSPDLNDDDLLDSAQVSVDCNVDGFVATNTTISRYTPKNSQSRSVFAQSGGLSGRPLKKRSLEVVSMLYDYTDSKVPIVGVGGIDSVDSAWDMITSGASLIQLYSALVFEGPSITSRIVKGLNTNVKKNNFSNISEAVGSKHT